MMEKLLSRAGAVALIGVVAVSLAACSSGGDAPTKTSAVQKGGTLTSLDVTGEYAGTDPVGVYLGVEIANFRRLVYRGLTALPITAEKNPKVVPDLATDTGTTKDQGKTWSFTLKKGLKWQDGKTITCADLQYGLSRSYDASLVAAGGGVGLTYFGDGSYNLIDPSDPGYSLATEYTGPLTGTAESQARFEKAASCSGDTITYHFQNAWADFPTAAAALFSTDPYQKSFDKGTANLFTINSNGPYKLKGSTFDQNAGGTFERNSAYSASSDSPDVRKALPDVVKLEFVDSPETITERLIADSGTDQAAYSPLNIPSNKYSQITPDLSSRVMTSTSPYTRFLEINSKTLTDPDVRNALIAATDKAGVVKASGGSKWGSINGTIVSSAIPGFQETALNKIKPSGDISKAKKLLAGKTPEIRYAFPDTSPLAGQVAAVLQQGWEKAGFKVTLVPIAKDSKPGYYVQVGTDPKPIDVFFAGWAADWPSLFAVIPPIVQSNPKGATFGVGFNYGFYSNSKVDGLIKQANNATDPAKQQKLLNEANEAAAADGAYVPLANQNNYFIYGSKVGGFLPDVASSYYPDLGGMYVKK
ncbi:MAG: ABC transporter substrate-binding protein [Microbacteriaceae bacterium]|nr:ABC transporter substrate-binding protein [Microbacteriaceae bacterium]